HRSSALLPFRTPRRQPGPGRARSRPLRPAPARGPARSPGWNIRIIPRAGRPPRRWRGRRLPGTADATTLRSRPPRRRPRLPGGCGVRGARRTPRDGSAPPAARGAARPAIGDGSREPGPGAVRERLGGRRAVASPEPSMSDEHEVRLLYEELVGCWNRRDAAGLARLFAEDGTLVGFDGSTHDG